MAMVGSEEIVLDGLSILLLELGETDHGSRDLEVMWTSIREDCNVITTIEHT